MTILGADEAATLDAVALTADELQMLRETLEIDELPVVLDAMGHYDTVTSHDAAMAAAAESLAARGLLVGGTVQRALAARLRVLYRPQWVVALRWYLGDRIDRLCIAEGAHRGRWHGAEADELRVVASRGPRSYVLDEAGTDLAGIVLAALGPGTPLELSGFRAVTEELKPILTAGGDVATTAEQLARVGHRTHDAQRLAEALVDIHSHASIVGVVYGEGTRDISDGTIAVFDTRHGRFIGTTTRSEDGTLWTSLATGTPARLRTALEHLAARLSQPAS